MVKESNYHQIDRLAEEFKKSLRQDKSTTVVKFAEANPENSDLILQLFPAIESLEQLRCVSLPAVTAQVHGGKPQHEQLGDFRIIKEIGRGGMGVVFLAEQVSLGRTIALKVLPAGFASSAKYAKRFEREAQIAAKLHHTHIVPVFGVGKEDETYFIAMQFIDGVGLDEVISTARAVDAGSVCDLQWNDLFGDSVDALDVADSTEHLPTGRFANDISQCIAEIGLQAANALQFAHSQGVLHRDVTPGNLLLDRTGKIWVADFGLASDTHHENITDTGTVMGTVNYVAPEQYYGECDERSDIYSLGMTLYELASLHRAHNAKEYFKHVASTKCNPHSAKSIRKFNPQIHRDIDSIISKAIEAEPSQRYSNAAELIIDLECYLNNEPLKTRRPNILEKLLRWTNRNRTAAVASVISLSLMLAVTVLSSIGYVRELKHRERTEILTQIATEALSEIYSELAPRSIPQDLPAIRSGRSPVSSFDVIKMPSDQSLAVLEKLQRHYEKVCDLSRDVTIKLQTADAKNRIGQINIHVGNLAAAEHDFHVAARICKEIIAENSDREPEIVDEARVLLAATWNQLGYVYRGQFNDSLASDAHEQAFNCLLSPVKSRTSYEAYQFEFAKTLYSRDMYVPATKNRENDSPNIARALEILNRLKSADHAEVQLLRARCYRRLSERQQKLPNDDDKESLQIMRNLVAQFPNNSQYRFELAYTLLGDQVIEVDPDFTYFSRVDEALTIASKLVRVNPEVPSYTQLAVLANEKFAHYWRVYDDPRAAAGFAETAILLQKGLLKRFPQLVPQNRIFLYALRLENANMMIEQEALEAAHVELLEVTSSVEELVSTPKLRNDWHALRVLTASLDSLARVASQTGRNKTAKQIRDKADSYRKRLYRLSG